MCFAALDLAVGSMNVAVLSGGVGGARFLRGVLSVVDPGNVSIVGNVADDLEVLGLHVSPDLDSILYTLTGPFRRGARLGPRRRELARARDGGAARRRRLVQARRPRPRICIWCAPSCCAAGAPLSDATRRIAKALGLDATLLPATDDPLRTFLETPAGTFPFQTWFVARGHRDEVDAVHYAGAPRRGPRPVCSRRSTTADVILVAPSNPYVSIGPILAVDAIRDALAAAHRAVRRGQPARSADVR